MIKQESFMIDKGDGNGYDMYYKTRGGFCFRYSVTFEDGKAHYSKIERVKRDAYNAAKANAAVLRYY